jgi:hypothetical protein
VELGNHFPLAPYTSSTGPRKHGSRRSARPALSPAYGKHCKASVSRSLQLFRTHSPGFLLLSCLSNHPSSLRLPLLSRRHFATKFGFIIAEHSLRLPCEQLSFLLHGCAPTLTDYPLTVSVACYTVIIARSCSHISASPVASELSCGTKTKPKSCL